MTKQNTDSVRVVEEAISFVLGTPTIDGESASAEAWYPQRAARRVIAALREIDPQTLLAALGHAQIDGSGVSGEGPRTTHHD